MPTCSIFTCKNNNRKTRGTTIKYFGFPKEKNYVRQWLTACNRPDTINLKYACICSQHFAPDCFQPSLKQVLLNSKYASKNERTLKSDAIPTLNLSLSSNTEKNLTARVNKRQINKQKANQVIKIRAEQQINEKLALRLASTATVEIKDKNQKTPQLDKAQLSDDVCSNKPTKLGEEVSARTNESTNDEQKCNQINENKAEQQVNEILAPRLVSSTMKVQITENEIKPQSNKAQLSENVCSKKSKIHAEPTKLGEQVAARNNKRPNNEQQSNRVSKKRAPHVNEALRLAPQLLPRLAPRLLPVLAPQLPPSTVLVAFYNNNDNINTQLDAAQLSGNARSNKVEIPDEMTRLRDEVAALQIEKTKLLAKIQKLEARPTVESMLQTIFTPGQIRKVLNPAFNIHWSPEDIASAISLHSVSSKAYQYLRDRGYPLPASSTLRMWSSSYKLDKGVFNDCSEV